MNIGLIGIERFDSKVEVSESGCWEWQAYKVNGYGRYWSHGRDVMAHRFAWERTNGPIPAGLTIDHLCRNRACVNPVHMETVTVRENTMRGTGPTAAKARQTHCIYGHSLADAYLIPTTGSRRCRRCHNLRAIAAARRKRRAAA